MPDINKILLYVAMGLGVIQFLYGLIFLLKNKKFSIYILERILSIVFLASAICCYYLFDFEFTNPTLGIILPGVAITLCLILPVIDIFVKSDKNQTKIEETEDYDKKDICAEAKEKLESLLLLLQDVMSHFQDSFEDEIDIVKMLDYFNTIMIEHIQADGGVVFLVDDYDDMISSKSYSGHFPPPYQISADIPHKQNRVDTNFKYIQFPLGETIFGEVAVSGKAELIKDGTNDPRIAQNGPEEFLLPGSYITVPLIVKDRVMGVAGFARAKGKDPFTEEDFNLASLVANFVGIAINNLNGFQEMLDRSDIEREALIAANIQKTLQPKRLAELPTANFGAFFVPVKGICGDYHDVIMARRDRIGIVIGDVAGKGIQSTMIMVMIRSILHLITNTTKDAGTILTWINRGITGRIDMDHYASLTFANYNTEDNSLEYASASHQPMLIWRQNQAKIETIAVASDPIGVERSNVYETIKLTVEPGDILILYTDGVVEAINAEGDQYGIDRLSQFITKNSQLSARELTNKVKSDIQEFCGSVGQHDDQTLLVMKIKA